MHDSDYQRRKDAYFALLDLAPAAREEWLDALASEDAAFAADLRAQVAAMDQPLALLDRAGDGAASPELAHYTLLRELGRGGMGRVWLAERRLGDAVQQVALKQIVHASWGEDDRRRFERERRILAGLAHPNIAALVDGGSDANGAPYLATVYVDGERIDRHVETNALPIAARVRLLAKVAAAVAYAHRQFVVHRDLKPANILVRSDGEPMLLDFGVARLLGEDAITSTGPSQMTLRYAAPEQVRGDAASGVGSDVYALGVLLYEVLAGASPYGDVRDQSALLAAILREQPLPPSRRAPGIDRDLDAIVMKALRKRAEDRYVGADAFADDLRRWLAHEPVEARRGERGYRTRAFVRRRWPWLAAASLAGAFIGYHLFALDRQLDRTERERDRAQALAGYFGDLFKSAKPSDTERGDISARELLDRSVKNLRDDTARAPATRATMLLAAADALGYLGRNAEARDAYVAAIDLLHGLPAPDANQLAHALSELASNRILIGESALARQNVDEALAIVDAGRVTDPYLPITLLQQSAMLAEEAGDLAGARSGYERAVELSRPLLHTREGVVGYLAAQTNIATWDMRDNDALPAAEARLREALEVAQREHFEDPYSVFPMRTYLARVLYDQNKLAEARTVLDPVLREARAWYGAQDSWLVVIFSHGATLATLEGRTGEAIAQLDALLAGSGGAGEDHPNRWTLRSDRAIASLAAGQWTDAIERLQAVLDWRARSDKPDGPNARFERAALAYARCRVQPGEVAQARLREALQDAQAFGGWKRWPAKAWPAACEGASVAAGG
ncbi:protein kinase domain-containing protein [Dokdonella sp.]|uniref:protein kinase domain-containing protein n=1 Tax=Dokdonella sp. TaxID=2291710 RepID=UPI003783A916